MKEENNKKEERESEKIQSHYNVRPEFGGKGPSKLRRQFSKGMTFFLVIAACIVFYFALLRMTHISDTFQIVFDVLKPVVYGAVIAYLLNPIVNKIDKYLIPVLKKKLSKEGQAEKLSRSVGIFVAIVFLITLIVALFNLLIPELYISIKNMISTLPGQLNDLVRKLNEVQLNDTTTNKLIQAAVAEGTTMIQNWLRQDLLGQVNEWMSNLTVGIISFFSEIFNALIGIIVSIYILFSKELFLRQSKKIVYAVMNPDHANMLLHLTVKSNEIFGGFIIGKIIDSAIIGILCFIGVSLMKMPYVMLVSVIVGVTNVIPFFGPYIGAIPCTILILLSDPIKGIYFVLFILVLQQFDGNILGPKILGDTTGLSAFWVVFSILFGGGMFGFVGMILGVPTFAVIYYIVKMLVNHQLENHTLPTDTGAYDQFGYVNNEGEYARVDEATEKKEEKGE